MSKFDIAKLFEKSDLIPTIIQCADTKSVLMMAYMNAESLQKSLDTRQTYFYSRSRKTLWLKGETSGHYQQIVDVYADCDNDTLLITVNQTGVACHTGEMSCFYTKISEDLQDE